MVLDGTAGDGADWDFERLMSAPDAEPEVTSAEPGGSVGMMYTSGTTGPPKGVVANRYDTSRSGHPARLGREAGRDAVHAAAAVPWERAAHVRDRVDGPGRQARPRPAVHASRFWDDCRQYEAVEFNTLGGMISILLKQPPGPGDTDHPVRIVLSAGCPPDRWGSSSGASA